MYGSMQQFINLNWGYTDQLYLKRNNNYKICKCGIEEKSGVTITTTQ